MVKVKKLKCNCIEAPEWVLYKIKPQRWVLDSWTKSVILTKKQFLRIKIIMQKKHNIILKNY